MFSFLSGTLIVLTVLAPSFHHSCIAIYNLTAAPEPFSASLHAFVLCKCSYKSVNKSLGGGIVSFPDPCVHPPERESGDCRRISWQYYITCFKKLHVQSLVHCKNIVVISTLAMVTSVASSMNFL